MSINDEELMAGMFPTESQETNNANAAETDGAGENAVPDTGADGGDGSDGGEENEAGSDGNASDDTGGGEGEVPANAEGEGEGETEEEAEVDPATGKPYTPEALAAKKVADEKEAFRRNQEEDPVNAPIPKYLKETTQKRMTKLVEIAKDLTAKHETAVNDRNEILGMITDTGATAQQYTQALAYLKMVNSRDPEQIQKAIQVMQAELNALSRMSGTAVAGVDLLEGHDDLKAALEAKQITPGLAQEIAAGREQRKAQKIANRLQHDEATAAQNAHESGIAALNEVGRELAKVDGAAYKAKAQAVLASIQPRMAQAHPSKWANMFLLAYNAYRPKAKTPVVPPARVPKNQPLRGNNPSGGQQTSPTSIEDAINMGIAAGTRQ